MSKQKPAQTQPKPSKNTNDKPATSPADNPISRMGTAWRPFQGEYARQMARKGGLARAAKARAKKAERERKVELARLGFDEALKVKAGEEIEALTDQWVGAAKRGESWALKGIWDRMEGTPTQRVVTQRAAGDDQELDALSDAELDELAREHGVPPLRLVRDEPDEAGEASA